MSPRRAVQDALQRFAFALEILEGPTPRARAYGTAARAVFQFEGDLAEARASGALARVRGLGPSCLAVIDSVLEGSEPQGLAELEAKVPTGLFEMRTIKGLGPAKIRTLHEGLGIQSLSELEQACKENRLVGLSGFGEKTQANILAGAAEFRRREGRMLRDAAQAIARLVSDALTSSGVTRVAVVGALAMGEEVVDGVELLACADAAEVDATLTRLRDTEERLRGANARVHCAEADRFGFDEILRTSDEAHLAALRVRAASHRVDLEQAFACAADVYEALGLYFVSPESRHAHTVLVVKGQPCQELITREQLCGALHNHTKASDGTGTLQEMREAATRAGLSYLGISEHSQSADYARGLSFAQLEAQRAEIAALNSGHACVLLTGVESDIRADGSLDYAPHELAQLDVVVASSHRRFSLDRTKATARMIAAAMNPRTDIIGHPTGRLLLGRPPMEMDLEAFLDACAANGCAVELNASAHRLDLGVQGLRMAKERGLLVSIAADAHAPSEIEEHLTLGITIARRAGLRAEDVLNAMSLSQLRSWLTARRARMS